MNAHPTLDGARWGQRAPAETFSNVQALLAVTRHRKEHALTRPFDLRALQAVPQVDGVSLSLDGVTLAPTPLAASQLSRLVGLPTRTVQVLSPELGAAALNERITATVMADPRQERALRALVQPRSGGGLTLRAVTSHRYARVWDADVIEQIVSPLAEDGWAPARVEGVHRGAPVGLFRSDRDLFCFLVHPGPDHRLPGAHGRPLQRGIVVRNSEVGGVALRVRAFWFDGWCTNHMVFGGTMAFDLAEPHREGSRSPLARLLERWDAAGGARGLVDQAPLASQQMYRAAAHLLAPWDDAPGATARQAADAFGDLARRARVRRALPQRLLRAGALAAFDYVRPSEPGLTVWHVACGITQAVQAQTPHQDQRMAVDEAVGRVLAAA